MPGFGYSWKNPALGGAFTVTVTLEEYDGRLSSPQQLNVKVSTEPASNVEGGITKYTLLLTAFNTALTGVIETAVKFKERSLTDQHTTGMDLGEISGYTTLPNNCKL